MSSFVLCTDNDWTTLYQADSHKWHRLQDAEDLLGFPSIIVYIHEEWTFEDDDRLQYLQEQIEILAKFGYVKIVYKYEDGAERPYTDAPAVVIPTPQVELFPDALGATTEPTGTISYETVDDSCEGGACMI